MKRPWVSRPADQRQRLRMWMPYQGSSNRGWLKDALGTRIRPHWNKHQRRWEVARPHLRVLVAALVERFGEVDVELEFVTTERCDTRCQQASGDDCRCSCLGENHGGAAYQRTWVPVGETTLVTPDRQVRRLRVRRGQA